MVLRYYAGLLITGLNTDSKPTNVPTGSLFSETNTAKLFLFGGINWSEISGITQAASESNAISLG